MSTRYLYKNTDVPIERSVYYSETNPTSYIIWRVIESSRVLELRKFLIPSQESTINQPGSTNVPVRFKFSAKILPQVTFFTDPTTRSLRCTILISSGILYRLDLPFDLIFNKKSLSSMNFYRRYKPILLQGKIPFMMHCVDFDNIIISSKDGNILYLKHQPIHYFNNSTNLSGVTDQSTNEDYFRENQLMGTLLTQLKNYILPSRRNLIIDENNHSYNDEILKQPISFASHIQGDSNLYVIYLRRDRNILVWSLNSNKHLEIDPLSSTSQDDEMMDTDLIDSDEIILGDGVRVLSSSPIRNSMSFDFIVYIPTYNNGFFGIYRVFLDLNGGLKQLNLIRREIKRREWRLWALWKRKLQTALTYTHFYISYYDAPGSINNDTDPINNDSDIIGKRWEFIIKTPIENHDEGYLYQLPDLQLDPIKICSDYIFRPGRFSASIIINSLEKYLNYIDFSIIQGDDLYSECKSIIHDYDYDLKQKVKLIVGKHIQLQNDPENNIPLENDYKQLVINEWIHFILLCIKVQESARFPLGIKIIQSGHFLAITQQDSISTIRICDILELFYYYTSNEFKFLNLLIRSNDELCIAYPKLDTVKTSDMIKFFKSMNLIVSPFLDVDLLSLERDICKSLCKPYSNSIRQRNIGNITTTGEKIKTTIFMDALISSSTADVIQSHYTIARNLYLLLIFMVCTKPNYGNYGGDQRVSMSMSTLCIHIILKWVSEQSAYSESSINLKQKQSNRRRQQQQDRLITTEEEEDGMIEKFSDLNIPEIPDLRYSLLHSLIHKQYPLLLNFRISYLPMVIINGVKELLNKFEFLPNSNPHLMIMSTKSHSKFGRLLFVSGFIEHLQQYVQFLLETPSSLFLHGEQLLKKRKYDKAAEKFIRAGAAFTNEMILPPYTSNPIIPSQDYLPGNLTGYYRHVATLYLNCQQHFYVIKFCTLALESFKDEHRQSPEGCDLVSNLCSMIFSNALKIGMFDEAYKAMMTNPRPTPQQANLRPFIKELCERKQSIKLQQYPFLDLRKDMEQILEFHARNHIPSEPPNYSMITYSYYISRKEFRDEKSGLAFDNFQKAMTDLASSYLSAIDALEQVIPPSLAWFHFAPLSLSDGDRKSYTLAMARLELGREFAEKTVTSIKSHDAVKLCSYAGKFDLAISIAELFDIPLDDIFERMTRKCLLPLDSNSDTSDHIKWVNDNETTQVIHGTENDKAWAMLRKYLDKFDKKEITLCRYRAVVLRTILTVNAYASIPEWLTSFYKTYNQEDHIRILMDFGRLSDAATAVLELMEKEITEHREKPAFHCLPWNIIESVRSLLKETINNPQIQVGKERLSRLNNVLDKVTNDYLEIVAPPKS
ncbi:2729_t:CDS:10 [Diversispora eburnea]|uniref:2729_t:CDS:1 n=1 Tax=Diversispora eburnea TaxID=1213867 RepID=A0A9N9ALV0_9GLOM|nr:2729_t:CDS:10 [Diversispora eburnea]